MTLRLTHGGVSRQARCRAGLDKFADLHSCLKAKQRVAIISAYSLAGIRSSSSDPCCQCAASEALLSSFLPCLDRRSSPSCCIC